MRTWNIYLAEFTEDGVGIIETATATCPGTPTVYPLGASVILGSHLFVVEEVLFHEGPGAVVIYLRRVVEPRSRHIAALGQAMSIMAQGRRRTAREPDTPATPPATGRKSAEKDVDISGYIVPFRGGQPVVLARGAGDGLTRYTPVFSKVALLIAFGKAHSDLTFDEMKAVDDGPGFVREAARRGETVIIDPRVKDGAVSWSEVTSAPFSADDPEPS